MPLLGQFTPIPFTVNIDFLLPNGLFLNLDFKRDSTLEDIRQKVWDETCKYSLIDQSLCLKQSVKDYILTSVSQEAVKHEFHDYSKRFSDLKLFYKCQIIVSNMLQRLYCQKLTKS